MNVRIKDIKSKMLRLVENEQFISDDIRYRNGNPLVTRSRININEVERGRIMHELREKYGRRKSPLIYGAYHTNALKSLKQGVVR